MLRRIPLGGMKNLRDLGGYPLPGGGATAWEVLLRGDTPHGLSPADLRWLLDRNITTVLDLRSGMECQAIPDQLADAEGFTYHHCPLTDGGMMTNLASDVGEAYFALLDGQVSVRAALSLIAAAPGGVLFHCTAGKDRTGLLAALLLANAGAERSDLLADYQITETYLGDLTAGMRGRLPDHLDPAVLERMAFWGRSRRAYLEKALTLLTEKYGGVPEYLRSAGLTEDELSRLKAKLTDR